MTRPTEIRQDLFNNYSVPQDDLASLGMLPDVLPCRIAGSGAAVNSTSTCLGALSTGWAEQASASVIKISSSSTNDVMTTGTGAWTVKVSGVDANYAKITDTVQLNGQTAVNTAKTFLFVEELEVLTAGTGLANAGTIYAGTGTVTSGVPATKYCAISVGTNVSRQAFYVVPAGYKFVLNDFDGQCGLKEVLGSVTIYRKTYGGLWESRNNTQLGYGSFAVKVKYDAYPEKTLIRLVGYSAATTQAISSALQGSLYKIS